MPRVDPGRCGRLSTQPCRGSIAEAGLEVPTVSAARGGGRAGVHAEAFGPMLAELQVLARAHPGAIW